MLYYVKGSRLIKQIVVQNIYGWPEGANREGVENLAKTPFSVIAAVYKLPHGSPVGDALKKYSVACECMGPGLDEQEEVGRIGKQSIMTTTLPLAS